jgi:competence protein ComEA
MLRLGWAALALAAGLAVWAGAPLLRPSGPDLGGFRPRVKEAGRDAGTGGTVQASGRPAGPKSSPAAPLDLNGATAAELATLPGIGPVMAARIVEHRQTIGAFPHLEALRAVPGLGPKRFAQLAPYLRVGALGGAAAPDAAGRKPPDGPAAPDAAGRKMDRS